MIKNKKFRLLLVGFFLSGLFLFLWACAGEKKSASSANGITIEENDIVIGNPEAKVTIVEFADMQCPACASFNAVIFSRVWRIIQQDTRWVFKNFPLKGIHPYAELAAKYSTAANFQGKYVEYHDLIFQKQSEWSSLPSEKKVEEKLIEYATELNLDIDKLKADAGSKAVSEKIEADINLGNQLGVQGTPTIFLNGNKISLPANAEEFYNMIINLVRQSQ